MRVPGQLVALVGAHRATLDRVGRRWVIAGAVSLGMGSFGVACFVDLPDVVTDGGGNDGGGDGAFDALPDIVIPPPSCEAGACGAPQGFQPVLFAADRNTPCPNGTTSFDMVANPGDAGAGACTCDCNVTAQPTCVPQTLVHNLDTNAPNNPLCTTAGGTWLLVDGGCNNSGPHPLTSHWSVPPGSVVDAGKCTGTAAANPSAVPSTPSRMCMDATCTTACAPAVGFSECFQATGDVPCPSGLTKRSVGTAIAVTCGSCSACAVSADGGCQGTLSLYSDTACATLLEAPIGVDGGCVTNAAANQTINSYQYSASLVGLTCTPGTSSATSVSLNQPQTICCP